MRAHYYARSMSVVSERSELATLMRMRAHYPIREKFTIVPTFFDLRHFFSQKKENPFETLMEIVAIGNRELHVVF